jgi:hypothetical protein
MGGLLGPSGHQPHARGAHPHSTLCYALLTHDQGWGTFWEQTHANASRAAGKPVVLEEFGYLGARAFGARQPATPPADPRVHLQKTRRRSTRSGFRPRSQVVRRA